MSRRAGFAAFLLAASSLSAFAQPATLTEQQQLGQRLVTQSCGVCHAKPQITAQQFGPVLSKDAAGGDEKIMRETILNGTPRMPGFKYLFEPAQVDAIVAYIKTLPAPAPAR
jgi:mono/diheme cytochrome c family protein